MKYPAFQISDHVYKNADFAEMVKDAVRFFNGTPVLALPPPQTFAGPGVYALYYIGANPLYREYRTLNRLAYNYPIYVGKAVPPGWRKSRVSNSAAKSSSELFSRLNAHSRSIEKGQNLVISDFSCRFVIFTEDSSDMIGTVEAALIKLNQPLWNSVVDGFGNHTPGKGRFNQAKSNWDVIHPGREWAAKCKGKATSRVAVTATIKHYWSSPHSPGLDQRREL